MILAKILSKRAHKREKELLKEIETKRNISEYKWGNIGKCDYSDELKEFVNAEVFDYGIISITEEDKLTPEERATMGSYNWGIGSPYPAPTKEKLKFANKQRYISKEEKNKARDKSMWGAKSPNRRNNSRLKYN